MRFYKPGGRCKPYKICSVFNLHKHNTVYLVSCMKCRSLLTITGKQLHEHAGSRDKTCPNCPRKRGNPEFEAWPPVFPSTWRAIESVWMVEAAGKVARV